MSQNRKKIKKYIIYLDHQLGRGAMGKVYMCYHESKPRQPKAVKIVDKKIVDRDEYLSLALKRQLKVHKKLKNINIVQLIDYEQTKNNIYIFQQFCDGSSLKEMIATRKWLNQEQVLQCAHQIINGFSQMVRKGVIHRDLKPQNILITSNTLKICDFGFSKLTYTQKQLTASLVGSPAYMAPQILQGNKYSSKCDVWSFGIILYELLYGYFPWGKNQRTSAGLLTQILTSPLTFPSDIGVNSELKSFIQNCLRMDEKLRLSWLQIFEHPIFNDRFETTASQIRRNMKIAASMLDDLVGRVNIVQLVGVFLQFGVKALDYQQFESIIKWQKFIPQANEAQIGFMYEMFDKDCNGVIDIYQFVKSFEICDENIPLLLNQLVQQGLTYVQLKDKQKFMKSCIKKTFSSEIIDVTWKVLEAITFDK